MSWRIQGTYVEACNCDVICPCRRIDGHPGGRSTHGVCAGALSWLVGAGAADGVDLGGLAVALAFRYSDDEPGSPWTWVLYLDDRASDDQAGLLEAIWSGRLGGDTDVHFPWTRRSGPPLAVRRAEIDLRHDRRRQRLRIRDFVELRIHDHHPGPEVVTCTVPGHDRAGEELVTEHLGVADGPLTFTYGGVCGYASTFDYRGAGVPDPAAS